MDEGAGKARGAKHFPPHSGGTLTRKLPRPSRSGGCAGLCTANSSRANPPPRRPRECVCNWGRRKVLCRRMGVGRQPGQAFRHLRPSLGVPGLGAPSVDWPPPRRYSQLGPHPQAARRSLSVGVARSPPPAARGPLPTLFSLLPSLPPPPPPPLHLQRPAARTAQFRPTAWHPSASAVCLGLGESNQERRLQFSGRAVRGASSLLFIHQQRRADPGLALACRRPQPLSALGSSLRRGRSPCAARTRGSAAFSLARAPLFPSLYPPTRGGPLRPGLSRPLRAAGCSVGVSLLSRRAVAAPRFPGHRGPTSAVSSSP